MAESPKIPVTMMLPRLPERDADLLPWAIDFSRAIRRHLERVGSGVAAGAATVFAAPGITYATTPAEGGSVAAIRSNATLPFPASLMAPGGTKTVALTDSVTFGALLTAVGAYSPTQIALMAPSGTVPFVVGPNGTMGRGTYQDVSLMFHGLVTITSASRVRGWNLQGLTAGGVGSTGGITGIDLTLSDQPSSASTAVIRGVEAAVQAATNANGALTVFRGVQSSYSGASASRGIVRIFSAVAPTSYVSQTVPSLTYYDIEQTPAVGTVSGAVIGFKQSVNFTRGTSQRGAQLINSLEVTANHVILSGVGKQFIAKDAIDGNFYGLSFQNGILMITNLGAAAPTT